MKYNYEVCGCVKQLDIPCFNCKRKFDELQYEFWSDTGKYQRYALWYNVGGNVYCYYCIEHLENNDPDWAIGVHANEHN